MYRKCQKKNDHSLISNTRVTIIVYDIASYPYPYTIHVTNKKLFLRREKFQFFPSSLSSMPFPSTHTHQTLRHYNIPSLYNKKNIFQSSTKHTNTHFRITRMQNWSYVYHIIIIILFLNVRWMDRRRRSCYFPPCILACAISICVLNARGCICKKDTHVGM